MVWPTLQKEKKKERKVNGKIHFVQVGVWTWARPAKGSGGGQTTLCLSGWPFCFPLSFTSLKYQNGNNKCNIWEPACKARERLRQEMDFLLSRAVCCCCCCCCCCFNFSLILLSFLFGSRTVSSKNHSYFNSICQQKDTIAKKKKLHTALNNSLKNLRSLETTEVL